MESFAATNERIMFQGLVQNGFSVFIDLAQMVRLTSKDRETQPKKNTKNRTSSEIWSPRKQNLRGLTALHLSAFGGHLRTCRALLRRSKKSINIMTQGSGSGLVGELSGKIDEKSTESWTGFFLTSFPGLAPIPNHLQNVKGFGILISKKKQPQQQSQRNFVDFFSPKVDRPSSHCWTPLMYGVWSNDVALVRELCRVGGRTAVNDLDRRGNGTQWSPLSLAVVRSSPEMVQALLELLGQNEPKYPPIFEQLVKLILPSVAGISLLFFNGIFQQKWRPKAAVLGTLQILWRATPRPTSPARPL